METWYWIIKKLDADFKRQTIFNFDSEELIFRDNYIYSLREELGSTIEQFKEFERIGLNPDHPSINTEITEHLDGTHMKDGKLYANSYGSEIIMSALKKMESFLFVPKDNDEYLHMIECVISFKIGLYGIILGHEKHFSEALKTYTEDIYKIKSIEKLIELSREIKRKLIEKTLDKGFVVLEEHIKEQLNYLKARSEFEIIVTNQAGEKKELILYPLPIRLKDSQRSELLNLLVKGKFISESTNPDSFFWVFGGNPPKQEQWQPIQWMEAKSGLRELLTPLVKDKTITNKIKRDIKDQFYDSKHDPFIMNKPKKDEHSARCRDIEKIIDTIKIRPTQNG